MWHKNIKQNWEKKSCDKISSISIWYRETLVAWATRVPRVAVQLCFKVLARLSKIQRMQQQEYWMKMRLRYSRYEQQRKWRKMLKIFCNYWISNTYNITDRESYGRDKICGGSRDGRVLVLMQIEFIVERAWKDSAIAAQLSRTWTIDASRREI